MQFDRRDVLLFLGYGALAAGCGDNGGTAPPSVDAPATTGGWATGGTAAMTDKVSYPDPFTSPPASCLIVATTTAGPCTTASDLVREDVSEGWSGLPVRFALKIVDASCAPLAGAKVKIWHTNLNGSYSGMTPNNNMCLESSSYAAMNFGRGVQTTAADGTVFFDTCFPGWYPGRAIHIHVQVEVAGGSTRVSQVFFPEDVTRDIFAQHPEYKSQGQPDTTFANDNVLSAVPSGERDRLVMTVARMTDGAMLASKVVTVA